MLKINKINRENINKSNRRNQLFNLKKEGIMETSNWTSNLIAQILETFEKLSGKEIAIKPYGRLEPVAIPVVTDTKRD